MKRRKPFPQHMLGETTEAVETVRALDSAKPLRPLMRWVPDYIKVLALSKKLADVSQQLDEVQARPQTLALYLQRLEAGFDKYEQERNEWFDKLVASRRDSAEPLDRLAGYALLQKPALPPLIFFEEIADAARRLPELPGAISEAEREKIVGKHSIEISQLQKEINKLSPNEFFVMKQGKVQADTREVYHKLWLDVQGKVCEPCSILGRALSTKDERDAHRAFDLRPNPYADFVAADAPPA